MVSHLPIKVKYPWVSIFIVLTYVLMFQWERQALHMGLIEYLIKDYSFQWQTFTANPFSQIPNLLSYTVLHADIVHLISNTIFFFLFAFFVERFMGSLSFLFLYITGGAIAALVQGFFDPFTNGLIGASGAIAAVGGTFFVLAPSYATFKKHLFFSTLLVIWYGLEWFQQLKLPALASFSYTVIAHGAHLGGFGWGALWGGGTLLVARYFRS